MTTPPTPRQSSGGLSYLMGGTLALVSALVLAAAIATVHRLSPENPERAVAVTVLLCLAIGVVVLAVYATVRRGHASPPELALAAFTFVGVMLGGFYLFSASSGIFQPADVLIWSESPFVNDIIKFRTGVPLYSAPADFDSFYYTPGSQLLTYGLASLAGAPTSVPAYRIIQLAYTLIATLVVSQTARRLSEFAGLPRRTEPAALWGALMTAVTFLAAGNRITNPFSYMLHNDALSLLICAIAFWALVRYAATRRPTWLILLAFVPAAGFMVKQSLAAWGPLVVAYLVLFDRPREWKRVVTFAVAGLGILAAAYGSGRAIWGFPFHHWVVTGLGNHPVSMLRAIQHALDGWAYFAVGFAAAAFCFRSAFDFRLLGLWCVWLALLSSETYTSGIAWMLNHMGPGSLLVVPWFGLLLAAVWPTKGEASWRSLEGWLHPAAICVAGVLTLSGLGAVRIPVAAFPPDLDRYVAAIEDETRGQDLSRVLIDHGSWLYLPTGVVMKDRMAAIGEAGITETGDFSGMIGRIRSHHYTRILVHDFDGKDFQYDHFLWRQSSGIRQALKTHYSVVRTIPEIEGLNSPWFRTISVLEPRADDGEKGVDGAGR